MSLAVTVSGSVNFKRFGAACKAAANTGVDKELRRGLREAGEDLAQAVRTSSDIFMPSGYEELFRARMLSQVDLAPGRLAVTVTIYAKGKSGRRDVQRLEKGILKHPVYGRYRALRAGGKYAKKPENIVGGRYVNPWRETTIRPGFFSVPIKLGSPRAIKRLDTAVGRVLDQI